MTKISLSTAQPASDDTQFAEELVKSAFAADALCLGPHWVYDTDELARLYPNGLKRLDAPKSEYHLGKKQGDFTHYGDQSLVLLESLAVRGSWTSEAWLKDWAGFWQRKPQSYLDGATRDTLDNYSSGTPQPSQSHDLAGASRMAPLIAFLIDRPVNEIVLAVRQQTETTHGDPRVSDAAEFFVRATFEVRNGLSYGEAFESSVRKGEYSTTIVADLKSVKGSLDEDPIKASLDFGQSCDVAKAFPLSIWLALKYENQPVELLKQNALVGGDSSARGMLLALLVAASGDFKKLPEEWTSEQRAADRISRALADLERSKS